MKRLTLKEMSKFWRISDQLSQAEIVDVDLTKYNYITHSALVSLASLIEYYVSNQVRRITVILPLLPMASGKTVTTPFAT